MSHTLDNPVAGDAPLTLELGDRVFWPGVAAVVGAAAAFLAHQLLAWPPHEDETLALFIGRDSLPGLIQHVTRDRGGAPLHFLVAWTVAHLGFGLGGLRMASALFAVGSIPLVALLGERLVGRVAALAGTALFAGSWLFLFHGIYGRMYSLFLFLATLSYLALLLALDRGDVRGWAAWCVVAPSHAARSAKTTDMMSHCKWRKYRRAALLKSDFGPENDTACPRLPGQSAVIDSKTQ